MKRIQMKSNKTMLILNFSVLMLIALITLGIISLQSASNSLQKQSEQTLTSLSIEDVKLTASRIEIQKRTLEMLALNECLRSMDWEIHQPILKTLLKDTDFLDIAVVQLDGTASYTDGTTSQLAGRDYIQRALKGETCISDVLISKVTNEPVIMVATQQVTAALEEQTSEVEEIANSSEGLAGLAQELQTIIKKLNI